MPALPTLRGASPLNADDADRLALTAGSTVTMVRALDDTPADFGTMDTGLTWTVQEADVSAAGDDSYTLLIRIMASDAVTVLAAADAGGTFQQVVSHPTTGRHITDLNRGPTAFGFVNTTADKTTWDGSFIELRQEYSQSMSNDNNGFLVDIVSINGNYTAGAAPPVEGTGLGAVDAVGTASGIVEKVGQATGDVAAVGTAAGVREVFGQAVGTVAAVGTAAGEVLGGEVTGQAQGDVAAVGTATGVVERFGQASGLVVVAGSAQGVRTVVGQGLGSVAAVGAAQGTRTVVGQASGAVAAVGSAEGQIAGVVTGQAQGNVDAVGTASGVRTVFGQALGAVTAEGTATGVIGEVVVPVASASRTWRVPARPTHRVPRQFRIHRPSADDRIGSLI